MKHLIFLFLAGIVLFSSCGDMGDKQRSYLIDGHITGIEDSTYIYMNYRLGDSSILDSALVVDGAFNFDGSLDEPVSALMYLEDYKGTFRFFLENTDLVIKGDLDNIDKVVLNGSAVQREYETLKNAQDEHKVTINDLTDAYFAARDEEDRAKMDAIESEIDSVYELQNDVIKDFIQANPGSYVSINQMEKLAYGSDYSELNALFNGLNSEIQKSAAGQKFAKYLDKRSKTAIGQIAPDFTQADSAGVDVSLSDFRGKYVLLDFWAAWCGPCLAENPNVVKNFQKYKDKNFTVLGVSLDDNRDKWLAAVENGGLHWTQLSDLKGWKNEASTAYGIRAIPANFLLGPDGKILAQNLRGPALGEKLAELLD